MLLQYLGLVPFSEALSAQDKARLRLMDGGEDTLIGFQAQPVVTLGVRAVRDDLLRSRQEFTRAGFSILRVDRGGQATLHNPGQLVIFPVARLRDGLGARVWVETLVRSTQSLALALGQELKWIESSPGLYDASGAKVVSVGVRLRGQISTHGLALNLHNDLLPFSWIRACGRRNAKMAHLKTDLSAAEVFELWAEKFCFHTKVDNNFNLAEFSQPLADVHVRL